eukprot:CAMPEP_0185529578 /NCGR_PEP_ID=MMETSP1366-20130426/101752_1 /TAXON_ID=38817 /ORGANISM="Gephyrocapsa oceanica, Strain RCC1303" /LENGTH=60 /DNA_ID=CAMNT_0028141201 /DNA_START=20 /DNA_END=199 /DNA_ORIENTATION=-
MYSGTRTTPTGTEIESNDVCLRRLGISVDRRPDGPDAWMGTPASGSMSVRAEPVSTRVCP